MLDGTISAKLGDSIAGTLKKAGVDVVEVSSYRQTLQLTQMNRVDGAAVVEGYGAPILKSEPGGFSDIVREAAPLSNKVGYLMFSKIFYRKNRERVERIWDALADMRRSGEIAKIKSRYIKQQQ